MVRVVLVSSGKGMRGGERQVLELGTRLRERGVEAAFAVRRGSTLARSVPRGFEKLEAGFERFPLLTPFALRRFALDFGADLMHAHTSLAHTHARLACRGDLPLVVSRRVAFEGSAGAPASWKYRRGVVHYIPISEAAAGSLLSRGVERHEMTVIRSGIDTGRFSPGRRNDELRRRLLGGGEGTIVSTAAAFEKEKGHNVLVEAAGMVSASLPGVVFVLSGAGSLEDRIRDAVERRGLAGSFEFVGDELPLEDLLAASDIYALPSIEEGLSTGLMAAMASGLACIASRTGGIPELLEDGAGILFEPGDAADLASGLMALASNARIREELGRRAARLAGSFDIERTVERTAEVYGRVLEKSSRRL